MTRPLSRVAYLRDVLGFDRSTWNLADRAHSVECSQCAALVVNGTPTHERGCPNQTHECAGCNERIPMNVKYCEDCK